MSLSSVVYTSLDLSLEHLLSIDFRNRLNSMRHISFSKVLKQRYHDFCLNEYSVLIWNVCSQWTVSTKEHLFSRTCSLLFLELVIAFVLYVCDSLSPSSSSGTNYPKQEQLLPGCASDPSFFSTQDSCDVAPVSWVQVSCLLVCAFVLGIHTPRAFPEKVFSFTLLCDRWSDWGQVLWVHSRLPQVFRLPVSDS